MSKKKYYPSQERYLAKNPVVSFRLAKGDKEKLEEIAAKDGKTPGQYVREFLRGIVVARGREDEIYDRGFSAGYNRGKEEWRFWFYCSVCQKPIFVKPKSEIHKTLVTLLKKKGWGHKACHEQKQ